MRVNIYYGGRGLIEDPTIYVINRMTEVLDELRVKVRRYNLYEEKNGIAMLPKTLKEADGIILAATVEWFGMGGLMQQFLDSCWLYGDKDKISSLYMMPLVTSTVYGEKGVYLELIRAWNILGGQACEGVCTYVEDHVEFELNNTYGKLIEKIAENLYRTINQKAIFFPSSEVFINRTLAREIGLPLTPQESEQLSMYVSNDTYVKKQKEDIEELSQMFREMLGDSGEGGEYGKSFQSHFHPQDGFSATYAIELTDIGKTFVIEVANNNVKCYYGKVSGADVTARTTKEIMNSLVAGRITFQRAFMAGDVTAKGNFKALRNFDTIFQFQRI